MINDGIEGRQIKLFVAKSFIYSRASSRIHLTAFVINLWELLSSYYIGTGAMYIGYVASFLGIPGSRLWRRSRHRYSHKIDKVILDLGRRVFDEVLIEEVRVTTKENYSGKYDNNMIKRAISYILVGEDNGDMPDELLTAHICYGFRHWMVETSCRTIITVCQETAF